MPRNFIGTVNTGLGNPLTNLIGYAPFPPNAAQMSWIRTQTYPTQGSPANVSTYSVASSFLFNIRIKAANASYGYVGFTYPYTFDNNGSGSLLIGGTTQAHDYYYAYITIRAYATYPRVFQYWVIADTFTIYSYSNPLNVYSGDTAITSNYDLSAIFS